MGIINKKISGKQRCELLYATSVIKELGYVPDEDMCGDAPDIVLPSVDDRQIGIEVVFYSTQKHEEAENALNQILGDYIEDVLDRKTVTRYEIGVLFYNLEIPVHVNFKQAKEELFKELNSFFFPQPVPVERKYIADLTAMENPDAEHSFIGCDKVVAYDQLNEKVLLECINKKEEKLSAYKNRLENKAIRQFFLVIYFSFNEHAELRGYKLPGGFETKYDRIYLVDSFFINRIK